MSVLPCIMLGYMCTCSHSLLWQCFLTYSHERMTRSDQQNNACHALLPMHYTCTLSCYSRYNTIYGAKSVSLPISAGVPRGQFWVQLYLQCTYQMIRQQSACQTPPQCFCQWHIRGKHLHHWHQLHISAAFGTCHSWMTRNKRQLNISKVSVCWSTLPVECSPFIGKQPSHWAVHAYTQYQPFHLLLQQVITVTHLLGLCGGDAICTWSHVCTAPSLQCQ